MADLALHRRSGRLPIARMILFLILGLFAAIYLIPLFIMVITSFKTLDEVRAGNLLSLPTAPTVAPWLKAWSEACIGMSCSGMAPYFWNSVKMVVPAVAISTAVGALTGYALALWKFKGASIVFALILFGCFIPFQIVLLPMARTLGVLQLASSTPGLILVNTVYGLAFTTLFFRNSFMAFPQELVKSATVDGAGFFQIWSKIIMPNSIPVLVVTVIWQFTNIWNEFLFGATFSASGTQPLTVALNNLVNSSTGVREYNVHMAAALIAAVPTLLVYVLAGRHFVRGLMAGAVKG
ncbi:carbohydrate ABC transporter permease (plasmid) [Shinella yambaruensis]|uniref:carbohydrate ABC transporter permease n=1 Tax=Shinella yambaruensis TaxID=415996 RepID=UPI003D7C0A03